MSGEKYKIKYGEQEYIKKFKKKLYKKMMDSKSETNGNIDPKNIKTYNESISNEEEGKINAHENSNQDKKFLIDNENNIIRGTQLNETIDSNYSENSTKKKEFRKKNVRLAPRTVNTKYSFQNDQSVNYNEND